jgi:sugar phosphate isomerase/epimerase
MRRSRHVEGNLKTLKGPGLFLAQFAADQEPFDTPRSIAKWAAQLGYEGIQIPAGDKRLFDLDLAASSDVYCEEYQGMLAEAGLQISELATHPQGQLVAVHPAYDQLFDDLAPPEVRGRPAARQEWAADQMMKAAAASRRLGLKSHATLSGSLAWPYIYPWPARPVGFIDTAFDELARRWRPILDRFDEAGVDVAYEIHPTEDLFDGETFERFLAKTGEHRRCCILFDPSHLHPRISTTSAISTSITSVFAPFT